MGWLSLRLVRLAPFALAASLFGYANAAVAQGSASHPTVEPAAAASAAPAAALPPAPPPPVATSTEPASPNAPPPAKAQRITAPEAHRAAEGDDGERYDDSEDRPSKRPQWYGWQTLIADAPSLTAFIAGVSMVSDGNDGGATLVWAGVLGYELTPSIIHFAHGNPGRGFASIGIRFGLPLAGSFIGASVASDCNRNLCELGGAGVGALLGMGGAIAIDAAALAYDDARPPEARHRGLVPLASLTPHRAWIGLGGEL